MRNRNAQTGTDRNYGISPNAYGVMLSAMWREYRRCRKSRGRNYAFGPERMLRVFLCRLYYNDTFGRIAHDFRISKSSAHRIFWRVTQILCKMRAFRLLPPSRLAPGVYTVDATVIRILRPSGWERQKPFYSGKHKAHCAKIQVITPKGCRFPLSVTFTRYGLTHDMVLFKRMAGKVPEGVMFDADSGYQGLEDLIHGSLTPYKKPKNGSLEQWQKEFNRELASTRITVEHANSYIKRFAILGGVYRGAVRNLECIAKLICGICMFELSGDTFYVCAYLFCGTPLIYSLTAVGWRNSEYGISYI